jgi:hypothetical protein
MTTSSQMLTKHGAQKSLFATHPATALAGGALGVMLLHFCWVYYIISTDTITWGKYELAQRSAEICLRARELALEKECSERMRWLNRYFWVNILDETWHEHTAILVRLWEATTSVCRPGTACHLLFMSSFMTFSTSVMYWLALFFALAFFLLTRAGVCFSVAPPSNAAPLLLDSRAPPHFQQIGGTPAIELLTDEVSTPGSVITSTQTHSDL